MTSRWTETIDEEWWSEGIGAVLDARGVVWYGYLLEENERIGPFRGRLEAERALEEVRGNVVTRNA
jgi:hypothetical protein